MDHFLKVDGVIAAQTPKIEPAFNSILNDFSTIVEIGFHRGALSLWLHRNKKSKTKLVCYDITFEPKEINDNAIDFRQGDCFNQQIIDEIKALIQTPGKTLLLCDGGHKEREFEVYAPFLKKGDVIMAHDYAHSEADYAVVKESLGWQTAAESNYVNIEQSVNDNNLEPYNYELFKNVLWGAFIKN